MKKYDNSEKGTKKALGYNTGGAVGARGGTRGGARGRVMSWVDSLAAADQARIALLCPHYSTVTTDKYYDLTFSNLPPLTLSNL